METKEKRDFHPKNFRIGCHSYNSNMEFCTKETESMDDSENYYLIPLKKEILEPMGFVPEYDEFSYELYFQRDYNGFRIRVYPMDSKIVMIDLKYLHTWIDVKSEGLHEMENYLNAIGIPINGLLTEQVVEAINSFGKRYFDYYREMEENFPNVLGD